MASRFRKELTVVPPVRINVSKRGLSTTIKWQNANVDVRLSAAGVGFQVVGDKRLSGSLPTDRFTIPGTRREYGGGNIPTMTSAGLDDFKKLLIATRKREREILSDVFRAKCQLAITYSVRALAFLTMVAALKPVREKTNDAVAVRKTEVATLRSNLVSSRIAVSFDMETEVAAPHIQTLNSFDVLADSQRKWAVETTEQIDRVKARSSAGTVISRAVTSLWRGGHKLVDTADPPLAFSVQRNKATAYLYPGFILVVGSPHDDFAIIDLKDVNIIYREVQFTEEDAAPAEARMVRKVWAKSNKNGTRDRRFKHNRELPVLLYGQLHLTTFGGMNEVLMFSRNEACRRFASALTDLKRVLSTSAPRKCVPDEPTTLTYDG